MCICLTASLRVWQSALRRSLEDRGVKLCRGNYTTCSPRMADDPLCSFAKTEVSLELNCIWWRRNGKVAEIAKMLLCLFRAAGVEKTPQATRRNCRQKRAWPYNGTPFLSSPMQSHVIYASKTSKILLKIMREWAQ